MFPVIFEYGKVSVQTFWVFVVIALLLSGYVAVQRLKRKRVDLVLFIQNSGKFLLFSLFVSRLIYFIFHFASYYPRFDFRTLINFFSIWDQGLSLWGGLSGFFMILTYKLYKEKEEIWKWYDALVVPVLFGMALVSIGQFFGGLNYGTPTDLPWGIKYETISVLYTVPVHPVQIYTIIIIAFLLWSKKKLGQKSDFFEIQGNSFLYLATLTSFSYFLLQLITGTETLFLFDYVRIEMIFFFILFALSAKLLYRRIKNYKNESTKTV